MKGLTLIPYNSSFHFIKWRWISYILSIVIVVGTGLSLWIQGLNLGIDFKGGILIEIRTEGPADLSALRTLVGGLELGEVSLQEFGSPEDVLIRIGRQPGGEKAQMEVVKLIQEKLNTAGSVEIRRVETVGPKMGEELVRNGTYAVVACLIAMLIYIWIRFEWNFSIAAMASLVHDAIAVIGLYTVFQLEFNSQAIVAVLITVGYSINDTVVIFDRIRENLRKYKNLPDAELVDLSINETLSRTILTSTTTLISLLALYFFGGEVIAEYSLPIIVGIIVGTYSSITLSAPLLMPFGLRHKKHDRFSEKTEEELSVEEGYESFPVNNSEEEA